MLSFVRSLALSNGWLWALALAGLIATYGKGNYDGRAHERTNADARQYALVKGMSKMRFDLDKTIAKAVADIPIKYTTITRPVERQIVENVVYRDCKHDDASVLQLNALLSGAGT